MNFFNIAHFFTFGKKNPLRFYLTLTNNRMTENPLTLTLLINSSLIVIFILNQNDNSKDSTTSQKTTAPLTFFEILTWVGLFIQLILLVFQIKTTEL